MIPNTLKAPRKAKKRKNFFYVLRVIILLVLLAFTAFYYQTHRERITSGLTGKDSLAGSFLAARYAERHHDYKDALIFLKKALVKQDHDQELLEKILNLQVITGEFEEAVKTAKQIKKLDEDSTLANMLLASYYISYDNFTKAKNTLLQITTFANSNNIKGLAAQTIVAWLQNDENWQEKGLGILEKIESGNFNEFIIYQKALIADAGDLKTKAKKYYYAILNSKNTIPLRLVETSSSFFRRAGEKDKAEEIRQEYLKEHQLLSENIEISEQKEKIVQTRKDGTAEILTEVGAFLNGSGLYEEAAAYLRLALYLRPNLHHTQYLLGSIMSDNRQFKIANEIYAGIAEDSVFYRKANINIAKNYYQTGDIASAQGLLEKLIKSGPAKYDATITLADMALKEDRFAEAAELYTSAIDKINAINKNHWFIFYSRGICYERMDEWKKAEKDFKKALELNPKHPDILNYLGYSWLVRDLNVEEAERMLQLALRQKPGSAYILDSYGWALYKMQNYSRAAKYIERAIELDPNDPTINDHLGDIYWQLKRYEEAKFQWKKALQFQPEAKDIENIKLKLEKGLTQKKNDQKKYDREKYQAEKTDNQNSTRQD